MRRESDIHARARTGAGRRARDRLLSGETPSIPALAGHQAELGNLLLFLGDDLRESALAVGGIEAFLVRLRRLLDRGDLSADELAELLDADDLESRIQVLDDALVALRRSMSLICGRL